MSGTERESAWWLDRKRSHDILFGLVAVVFVGLLAADFAYEGHPHFWFEKMPFFFAAFGFGSYVLIVASARVMRAFLMRGEDYYDR